MSVISLPMRYLILKRGFSLLELLAVVAILAVLGALAIPAIQGMASSMNLKGSANILVSEIDLARATASSRNLAVDVRIYQDFAPKDAHGNPVYHITALVIPALASGNATDEYVNAPMALQGDTVIDPDLTYSTLLNASASATLAPVAGVESSTAPLMIQSKPYVKFTVLPSGGLNLDNSASWCVTLLSKNKVHSINGKPADNFITLSVDVSTGRVRTYQP